MKLLRINAENANGILIGQLEKSGYTKEEVIFLNGVLTRSESGLGQLDQESLTAEKIAVKCFKKPFCPEKSSTRMPFINYAKRFCVSMICFRYVLMEMKKYSSACMNA